MRSGLKKTPVKKYPSRVGNIYRKFYCIELILLNFRVSVSNFSNVSPISISTLIVSGMTIQNSAFKVRNYSLP